MLFSFKFGILCDDYPACGSASIYKLLIGEFFIIYCKDPGFERMIRDGINGVMMIIRVDLKGLVKFGAVSLRTSVQRRYPGAFFSSDESLR